MKILTRIHRFYPAVFFLASFFLTSVTVTLASITTATTARAETLKTVTVLPFTINATQDIAHLQNGILQMLYSRLTWQDHLVVIPTGEIKSQLSKMTAVTGDELIGKMAAQTDSQYVVAGSVTKIAGAFSIDTQVYDIENQRFMPFFEQSEIADDLIDKVDQIAAAINKEVFNRSTVTYEKMEQKKQAHLNQLKRQNPEHLMTIPQGQQEKGPGWKIWKYIF